MPRLNLRLMPVLPDPHEEDLRDLARVAGLVVKIDGRSRSAGLPHVWLFKRGQVFGTDPIAKFGRASKAIRWLESGGQFGADA